MSQIQFLTQTSASRTPGAAVGTSEPITSKTHVNTPRRSHGNRRVTSVLRLSAVSYERILAIENLSEVPNPWKGFTMNRCLVVALVVLLVTSGVSEVHGECWFIL